MIDALFLPYLVALALIPSLVWWRWGLAASLGATVLELMLVPLVFYLLAINHLLPDVSQGRPPLETHPVEYIRRSQGDGYVPKMFGAVFPGIVVLIGGALAVACAAVHATWRVLRKRGEQRNAP
jgi:hypothetical protein